MALEVSEKYLFKKGTSPAKTLGSGTNTVTFVINVICTDSNRWFFYIFHSVHYDSIVTMHTLS
jgi:hypothetical protein